MSRTQLPAQTLGEAVEALNWVGNWAVGGHDRTRSFVFPKKNRTPREFFGGETNWLIDAVLQLNACKNLHHCNMQQGSFTMGKGSQSSTVLFQSPSKNLGVWELILFWKLETPVLLDRPSLPSTKIAASKYMPTQCLVNFKECSGSDYRKTTVQTNGSPNKKDSNQISSSTAPHWLPVGTRSCSHCGCDVTVGISPQGWFGRINLHAWWFNGHTIDSPICYTKANSTDLPWFSQPDSSKT